MRGDELMVTPHPFLEGMCEQQLKSLSEAAMRASFAEGEWIFREKGEPQTVSISSWKGASLLHRGCLRTVTS